MVHFLTWLVISDYALILVEVVLPGRPGSPGHKRICLQKALGFVFHVILLGFMLISQLKILVLFGGVTSTLSPIDDARLRF